MQSRRARVRAHPPFLLNHSIFYHTYCPFATDRPPRYKKERKNRFPATIPENSPNEEKSIALITAPIPCNQRQQPADTTPKRKTHCVVVRRNGRLMGTEFEFATTQGLSRYPTQSLVINAAATGRRPPSNGRLMGTELEFATTQGLSRCPTQCLVIYAAASGRRPPSNGRLMGTWLNSQPLRH